MKKQVLISLCLSILITVCIIVIPRIERETPLEKALEVINTKTEEISSTYKDKLAPKEIALPEQKKQSIYTDVSSRSGSDAEHLSNSMESIFKAIDERAMEIDSIEQRELVLKIAERYKELMAAEILSKLMEDAVLKNMSESELETINKIFDDAAVSDMMEKQNEISSDLDAIDKGIKEINNNAIPKDRIEALQKGIDPNMTEMVVSMQLESLKFTTATISKLFDEDASNAQAEKLFNERYKNPNVIKHMKKSMNTMLLAMANHATQGLSIEEIEEINKKLNADEVRKYSRLQIEALTKHFENLNE